jgi:hypothetical protein
VAPVVDNVVPKNFPAGTTVRYTRTLDEFQPSDGWAYTIYLNGLTQKFNKAALVVDGIFQIQFDPSDTSSLAPGPYRYAERLTNPGTAFVLTGVTVDGEGNAIYAFSSFSNLPPFDGMKVTITGFSNSGNNVVAAISSLSLDGEGAGSFVVANGAAVPETHAASGAGAAETFDITGDELVMNIEPNVSIAAAGAFNSWEERTLAVIEAALSGRLTADIQSYQIAGRAVTKIPVGELLQIRGTLQAKIWRQTHPGQLGVPYKVEFPVEGDGHEYPPTWQDVTGLGR